MAVPSTVMRSANQTGTRPPCSGRSAIPERFILPSFYRQDRTEPSGRGKRDVPAGALLLELVGNRNRDAAGRRPFGAARQSDCEAGALHGVGVVTQSRYKNPPIAVRHGPKHRLVHTIAWNGLFRFGLV